MRLPAAFLLSMAVAALPASVAWAQRPVPSGAEAVSLTGQPLFAAELSEAVRTGHMTRLEEARRMVVANPRSADALIWFGRRTAYLGRYRDAIAVFSTGIGMHPTDARMYRHRGHRWLSVREFDLAIADFDRAVELVRGQPDEVEPDGLPNARGIPTSTLQSNIWYHLALAHYVKGDFAKALPIWQEDVRKATNPDMQVASTYWLYMTLRRLGRDAEAARVLEPITADMNIIENTAYHRLLLLNKGLLTEVDFGFSGDALQEASAGYGLGNWHFYNGRVEQARQVWRRVLAGGNWASFGYVAAEAELARGR
ncbi:MAG: tetratricopeptide repeat protein [Gemmatimonadota bacterium]|nr:tetratricopeptide repeat protein [Gemmatimonadota bacterium]